MWKRFGLQEWFLVGFTVFATVIYMFLGVFVVTYSLFSPEGLGTRSYAWRNLLLIPGPFLFLAMWYWMLWWLLSRRQFDPSWRGVTRPTPTGVRVHLHPMLRMGLVWYFLLATTCGVPFILGLAPPTSDPGSDDLVPSRPLLAGMFTLLMLGAAVGGWLRPSQTGHVHDDERAGTLNWWTWYRRGRERSVVRHWVRDVNVREEVAPPFDTKTYSVVIHWNNWDDERMSETIVQYGYEADAEALTVWIRGRLGLAEGPHPPSPSP